MDEIPDGLRSAVFDALPVPCALLNESGEVVWANERWDGEDPRLSLPLSPGSSGPDVSSEDENRSNARVSEARSGIRSVLRGDRDAYQMEFASQIEDSRRWFLLRARGFTYEGTRWVNLVRVDITNRRLKERELEYAASHDFLTGLLNHRYFIDRLDEEIARALRYRNNLAVMLLDLDRFKRINDRYGHHTGDRVLETVGELIGDSIREHDFAGRYGGEEFAVGLPQTGMAGGRRMAERIRHTFENYPFEVQQQTLTITCSIGVTCLDPQRHESPERLLHRADQALYNAKEAGRNRVEFLRAGDTTP